MSAILRNIGHRFRQAHHLAAIYFRNRLISRRKRDGPLVLFDFSGNTILKRHLFAAAYCLDQAGCRILWAFRPRFLLRTHEEIDSSFYRLPFFRFVLFPASLPQKRPLAGIATDTALNEARGEEIAHFHPADDPNAPSAPHSYRIPLSLGLKYLFEHRRWVPEPESIRGSHELRYRMLFVGNCSPRSHGNHPALATIGILRRPELVELLLREFPGETTCLRTWAELETFRRDGSAKPILILDASQAAVFSEEYWNLMLQSAFFLAMPGIASVHTHSLAESLACGCCPVLQQPTLIHPELRAGENCIEFGTAEHFVGTIQRILAMGDDDIDPLRAGARSLYDAHFSPVAVGRNLFSEISGGDTILCNPQIVHP